MSALLHLGKQTSKLGISASEMVTGTFPTNSLMGLRVRAGEATLLGGKQDGELASVIEVNQTALLFPNLTINPVKYQTLISVNPELLRYGTCSYATIVEPGEGKSIFIQFKAARRTDLNDLEYLLTLYQLD